MTSSGLLVLLMCVTHVIGLQCGGEVDTSGTVITTPNYPNNFDANDFCEWNIEAPPGTSSIKITFQDFQMRESEDCSLESVVILDGEGNEEGRFCGLAFRRSAATPSFPLSPVVVEGSRATLQFTSGDARLRGFRATVTFPTCPALEKCFTGETELVTDSDGCEQCVCEGCPPVECPDHCTSGTFMFKEPDQDCFVCKCKAGCPPDCKRDFFNGEFICNCKENALTSARLADPFRGFANEGEVKLTVNGQERSLCFTPFSIVDELIPAICNDVNLFLSPFRISIGRSFPRGDDAPRIVYQVKSSCPVDSLDLDDYIQCLDEPIKFEDCQGGLLRLWCIGGSYIPSNSAGISRLSASELPDDYRPLVQTRK